MTSALRTGVGGSLATEGYDGERALARLPDVRAHAHVLMRRFGRYVNLPPGARFSTSAPLRVCTWRLCARPGYDAVGVEPWADARRVSEQIARHINQPLTIRRRHRRDGSRFPTPPSTSCSPPRSWSTPPIRCARPVEAHRVLKPGGGFYFWTTSVLCPRQGEIARFPAFSVVSRTEKKA